MSAGFFVLAPGGTTTAKLFRVPVLFLKFVTRGFRGKFP